MLYRQAMQLYFRGVDGSTSMQFVHTQADPAPVFGSAEDVITAAQGCSVGGLQAAWLAPVQFYGLAPSTGPYSSCWDKAIFTWRSSSGAISKTVIPAPGDIFLPDAKTVDLANPLVVAYTDACRAALADSAGNPLVTVTSAVRARYRPGIG